MPPRSASWRRVHLLTAYALALPLVLTALSGAGYRILRSLGYSKPSVRWMLDLHSGALLGMQAVWPVALCVAVLCAAATGGRLTVLGEWVAQHFSPAVPRLERHQATLARELARFEARQSGTAADARITDVSVTPCETSASEAEESDSESLEAALSRRSPTSASSSASTESAVQRLRALFVPAALLPGTYSLRWAHRVLGSIFGAFLVVSALTGAAWTVAAYWVSLGKVQYAFLMYIHEGRWVESSGTVYTAVLGAGVLALSLSGGWMALKRSGLYAPPAGAVAYARLDALNGSDAASAGGFASSASYAAPSASTLARIHRAFDLDDDAEETEDEGVLGSPQRGL